MVTGSGLGLARPAIKNTVKISGRRHVRNRWWVKIPARFSMTRSRPSTPKWAWVDPTAAPSLTGSR